MTQDKEQNAKDETFAVLPWYVNGSLAAGEAEKVRLHLEHCVACQEELAVLISLRRELGPDEESLPAAPPENFNRIMERIENYEAARSAAVPGVASASSWRTQLSLLWSSWGRVAFATQFAALLVLLVVLAFTVQQARTLEEQVATERTRSEISEQNLKDTQQRYETLAGAGFNRSTEGALLMVAFQQAATEKEIRELLNTIKGSIVSGPSAQNMYVVELIAARGADREQVIAAALNHLQARPAIVQFAAERR
jgi:hypothetical protein